MSAISVSIVWACNENHHAMKMKANGCMWLAAQYQQWQWPQLMA